jgi:hypothetical protein
VTPKNINAIIHDLDQRTRSSEPEWKDQTA